jgi:thymidylate synthase (FAD)
MTQAIDGKTMQEFIAYCARVSNPKNQDNSATAERLLKFLAKEAHWSPLEMANIVMEIKTSRDIARQILRHRSFSFQEFSQRYADPTEVMTPFYKEARIQNLTNRQVSDNIEDQQLELLWQDIQTEAWERSLEAYKKALDAGIAKEQARSVLPEGITPSVLYMNGTLRSWLHYCSLRRGNGTQKEHIEIADKCWQIIASELNILTRF